MTEASISEASAHPTGGRGPAREVGGSPLGEGVPQVGAEDTHRARHTTEGA